MEATAKKVENIKKGEKEMTETATVLKEVKEVKGAVEKGSNEHDVQATKSIMEGLTLTAEKKAQLLLAIEEKKQESYLKTLAVSESIKRMEEEQKTKRVLIQKIGETIVWIISIGGIVTYAILSDKNHTAVQLEKLRLGHFDA